MLLTGYSGQISLAQYVFFGLGAFAMGKVAGGDSLARHGRRRRHRGARSASITALPAMRLQGLYLALVTFALAQVSRDVIFQDPRTYGAGPVAVGRLEVFGVSFEGDRAVRGAVRHRVRARRDRRARAPTRLVRATARRHARQPGRLRHPRPRRAPHQARGVRALLRHRRVSPARCTAGSGFSASQLQFEPLFNVLLFLFAFVGGITTITGALLGGLLFAALPLVQSEAPELAGLVFAAIAVTAVALGKQPNGMAGLLFAALPRRRRRRRAATAAGVPWSRADCRRWSMRLPDRRRSLVLLMGAARAPRAGAGPGRARPGGSGRADRRGSSSAPTTLEARGQGVRVRYEIEGMLPGGTPVLDLGMPEALARFTSGPTGYGVASLAYPGGVIVNLPSLVEQAGGGERRPAVPDQGGGLLPDRAHRGRRRAAGWHRPEGHHRGARRRRARDLSPPPMAPPVLERRQRPHRRAHVHRGRQGA